jgi:hypothetical protein
MHIVLARRADRSIEQGLRYERRYYDGKLGSVFGYGVRAL